MSRNVPLGTHIRPYEDYLLGRRLWCTGWIGGLLVACVILIGCALPSRLITSMTPGYRPENVFLYAHALSPDLKCVAVLPLACEDRRPDLQDGCEALNPVFQAELIKTRKFEVVGVSPEVLRNCTGRMAWTGTEVLPQEFFDSLREVSGCDAVLLCQLTAFRAYEPLAVGWRMRLVDARTGQTLWAVDELFDAGHPSGLNGARHYQWAELQGSYNDSGRWLMRNSPREFGQYAAAQVLATLPKR